MTQTYYPPAPVNPDFSKLEPSKAFKKQVGAVIFSIVLFFIVYLLLILLSLALVAACFLGCVYIVSASPGFLTLMLGLGLLILGVSVFIFLVKFIFAKSEEGNPLKIEVIHETEPKLFEFVKKLTEETKTAFPKKIYISPDVNACVFYNSSFWSMFLPVRKNLEIGAGLVNSLNASEFKAVMAHEFGHFSQRSMKLGSFTYNVNKVIYNMLYNNNSYNNFLHKWSNISGYFALFASMTAGIANGIRYILNAMYNVVNKSYMALSREMEFHADAVAASVAGGNNLISSLNKLEVAASCYNTTIENANTWLKEKQYSGNLFNHQLSLLQTVAKDHKLELVNGLPLISSQFLQSFSRSRINYKNQWASHPSLEERTQHLQALQMNAAPSTDSSWVLFKNPIALQQEISRLVYGETLTEEIEEKPADYFFTKFLNQKEADKLPEAYNNFYNGRIISTANWDVDMLAEKKTEKSFENIFTEDNARILETIQNNQSNIEIIKNIQNKQIDIKSFDFDGEKVSLKDTERIMNILTAEAEADTATLEQLEKDAFIFFQQQKPSDHRLRSLYKTMQLDEELQQKFTQLANKILGDFNIFYQGNISIEYVEKTIQEFKETDEKDLKEFIHKLISQKYIVEENNKEVFNNANSFNGKDYAYFSFEKFHNEELNELHQLIFAINDAIAAYRWEQYKKLLNLQLEYYHSGSVAAIVENRMN